MHESRPTAERTPHEILRKDPVIKPLIADHGQLTLNPADDPFKRTIRSIINQQVSNEAGRAIRNRLFASVEITPKGILEADPAALSKAGLSGRKVEYVRSMAAWFDGIDIHDYFLDVPDPTVIEELTEIRGVGVWTAKMILMFVLTRNDVYPVEDLAIRRAMTTLYDVDTREDMRAIAESWRPYRSYGSLYLWRFAAE